MVKIFGTDEFALRAFSAAFGFLSILLVFYIGMELFDPKTALLSSFLASINLTLLWYSQEARQYIFLLFLSLFSVLMLFKYLKAQKSRFLAGLFISNALIVYSQFSWIIFLCFEGIYILYVSYSNFVKHKKIYWQLLALFLVLALLYIPIIGKAIFSKTDTVRLYGRPDIRQFAEFGIRLVTWMYPSEPMRQKIYEFSFANVYLNGFCYCLQQLYICL